MKPINAIITSFFLTLVLLPAVARADWSNPPAEPGLAPHPMPVQQHIDPQYHRIQPQHQKTPQQAPAVKPAPKPIEVRQAPVKRQRLSLHDKHYLSYSSNDLELDDPEVITPMPMDVGDILDSIPPDYQVEVIDGVNYLVSAGTYYQRVGNGFEVVDDPDQADDS
jgi:hypothetical protein